MTSPIVNLEGLLSEASLGSLAEEPQKPTPFEFHVLHHLLDKQSLDQLRQDVANKVKLSPKDNDLYKFKQSKDLKSEISAKETTPLLNTFIGIMLNRVRPLLEEATKLQLSNEAFDITVSSYDTGDYLLCHNDHIKEPSKQRARALAFIFYLNTRPWTKDDGGALILYDSDASGEPTRINNYIHPKPNTLVVFKTSATSWHSVQEVFCKDDLRLSINGWFHHANLSEPTDSAQKLANLAIEPSPYNFLRPIPLDERMEKFFGETINGQYLMEKTCYLIRRKFKRNSEINLPNFLTDAKFSEIGKALKEAANISDNLQHVGPYNKRNYKRVKVDKLPPICKDLYDAFRSELFFMLLSRFTGLDLQPPHLAIENKVQGESSDDDDDDEYNGHSSDEDENENENEDKETEDEDGREPEGQEDGDGEISAGGEQDEQQKDDSSQSEAQTSTQEVTSSTKRKRDSPPVADPLARLEFRHLETSAYTLIHDYSFELGEQSALDVILHFNHDFEVKLEHGGYISYIDVSDSEDTNSHNMDLELLTIEPKSNCLSLVYRSDSGTCRFMKYITSGHKSSYQDLYCVYYERPDDLPLHTSELLATTKRAKTQEAKAEE